MKPSQIDLQRHLAIQQFHRARRQAAIESIMARLSGQKSDLLSYEEVVGKLGVSGQSSLGVQQIPVTAIVGSVGRYEDFSRTFLPRMENDEDRWTSVAAAAKIVTDLPPIEVYKIDDSYFVLDGNHRVSVARQQGIDFIDAYVTEIRTRVPLPPGGRPDDLIIAAEYADFLDYTQLDKQREGIDLRVSVPGQYTHLENHIEAHRFWIEKHDGRDYSIQEAAARWYDEAYLPLVEAVREQGVMCYFPGRTETDFFIWLSRHRAELQNQLKTIIAPDLAVARIAPRFEESAEPLATPAAGVPLRRRLSRLFVPERANSIPVRKWSEDRRLARYSDHLFANITWPVCIEQASDRLTDPQFPLSRVLMLAVEEEALLWVLAFSCSSGQGTERIDNQFQELREAIVRRCRGLDLIVNVQFIAGDPVQQTIELAYLSDLIVLPRDFPNHSSEDQGATPFAGVRSIINHFKRSESGRRPLWILGDQKSPPIVQRVLLAYHGQRNSEEALFIAAYLSERWRVELVMLPVSNGQRLGDDIAHAREYLDMHEIETIILNQAAAAIDPILEAAKANECDLLILSMSIFGGVRQKPDPRDPIFNLLEHWSGPILLTG